MLKAIPAKIKTIIKQLESQKYEAYLVGGCVRDLLLKKTPKDWDIATSAQPEQIQQVFPDSFYDNQFGTVGLADQELGTIEITTFRQEQGYDDSRHPNKVEFVKNIEQDLGRRDFTINAMALGVENKSTKLIDPFAGQVDLERKIIRAVGQPQDRFQEDGLRLMRAVRLAGQLDFTIEPKTLTAVKQNAQGLAVIAKERIRDELIKIIMTAKPAQSIDLLRETGLLGFIMPELEKGVGIEQNQHHIFTIYEHGLRSLQAAADNKFSLEVRLAALLHDIAKPQTKQGQGREATFYNHDMAGARLAKNILQGLRFSRPLVEKVAHLIRCHMFVYDVEQVTEAGVRRLLRKAGQENIKDLIGLRIADRLGSGCPKAKPYKLRHLEYVIDKVSKDPIAVNMLKIDGHDLMKLGLKPGPRMGLLLNYLLAEVLEEPKKNKKKYLSRRVKELESWTDDKLRQGLKVVKEKKQEVDEELKSRHWVQ